MLAFRVSLYYREEIFEPTQRKEQEKILENPWDSVVSITVIWGEQFCSNPC